MLIGGKLPGVADLHFGLVDVRDVAEAHYLGHGQARSRGTAISLQ
jgi:dihydroflavonol-4-reductase